MPGPVTPARATPGRGPGHPSEVDRCRHRCVDVDPWPDPELLLDPLLELFGDVRVLLEERADVLLALAQLLAVVGVPGAGLANDALLDAHVDERAFAGDALAVDDVELGLLERRGDPVLDHLDPGPVADDIRAVLERLDAPDVQPDRGVELQRFAARGRLRTAEHH